MGYVDRKRARFAQSKATPGSCPCQQEDATAAIAAIGSQDETELLDDTHFRICLRTCQSCGQVFLYVMTETIDWVDGEDPVQRVYFPVTPAQAAEIRRRKPQVDGDLEALGLEGPYLLDDWPSKGPAVRMWQRGPLPVFSHD